MLELDVAMIPQLFFVVPPEIASQRVFRNWPLSFALMNLHFEK